MKKHDIKNLISTKQPEPIPLKKMDLKSVQVNDIQNPGSGKETSEAVKCDGQHESANSRF